MILEAFGGCHTITKAEEISFFAKKRNEVLYNGLWLSLEEPADVSMSILIKENLADAPYFPKRRHPGFHSLGRIVSPRGGTTRFRVDSPLQEQPILNYAIIPLSAAIAAARQFFAEPSKKPKAIEWFEL